MQQNISLPVPEPKHQWTLHLCPGVVAHANTAQEARACFKRHMGVDRLPVGVRPVRVSPAKQAS